MGLPVAPQIPVAGMGPRQQGIQGPPPGMLPYKPSGAMQAGSVMQGIAQFMKDFRATKEAEKTQAQQEFQNQLQMISQGVPLDLKKVAKTAQRAGIPFDFAAPSAEQINAEKQKQTVNEFNTNLQGAQAGGSLGAMGGLGGFALEQLAQQGGVPAPPSPPAQPLKPKSGWDKLAEGMGWSTPPVGDMSPGMMYLEMLKQSGGKNLDMKKLMQESDLKTQQIRYGALMGNPQAVEMYTKLGGMKEPSTELGMLKEAVAQIPGMPQSRAAELFLDRAMGGPQMRQTQLKAAMDAAAKDVDVRLKVNEQVLEYSKNFPGLAPAAAYQLALGSATGNKELFEAGMKYLQATKSEAELARGDKEFEKQIKQLGAYVDLKQLGLKEEDLKQGWARIGQEGQRIQLEKFKIDTQIIQAVRGEMGKAFDDNYKIAVNDKLDDKARDAALTRMTEAANAMGTLKVKTTDGKTIDVNLSKLTKDEWKEGILWNSDPWSTMGINRPDKMKGTQAQPGPATWMSELFGPGPAAAMPKPSERQVEEWRQTTMAPQWGQNPPQPPAGLPPGMSQQDTQAWIQQMLGRR